MTLRLFAFCGSLLLGSLAAQAADKPNVVVIYADDLGWGDLSCYGHPTFKTPNIDSLATDGAKLTNFYSCCPYCAPSRVGLQTGRYQFRSGVTTNPAPDGGINDVGIPSEELTLGEMFKAAGYATACVGKWHLGHKPEFHPLKHGYDEYLGILYSNDMRPVELWDGPRPIEYPVYQATLTRRYTERAVQFIERNRERPFFLYLPHAMPHKPLAASEAFYKKSGDGLYADVLAELDWGVGQVLGALHGLGLEQNTLVFFSSDNGPWFGGSSGGLRGMKGQTWEGGIRVPLLARWPGRIPAGHVSHEPAIILDLFATSLAAAGITPPQDRVIDGRDILPLLTTDAKTPHEALYSIRGNQLFTVRSGQWKYHGAPPGRPPVVDNPNQKWIDPRAPDGVTILAPYEQATPAEFPGVTTGDEFTGSALFDLQADTAEQHNVAAQHPEVVARLEALYQQMNRQLPPRQPPARAKTQRSAGGPPARGVGVPPA